VSELYELIKDWPKAVDPELMCDENSEDDKIQRAKNILSFFVQCPLEGKRVLDFGCGEGHVANELSKNGIEAFGYDLSKSSNSEWDNESSVLSTNFEKIKSSRPFDVIILYDVIDHALSMDNCLSSVRELCDSNTTVYNLTHPWCSRHGGHLYQKFNYAFAHVLFDDIPSEKINKVVNPIMIYENLFEKHGFEIMQKEIVRDPVEYFFEELNEKILAKFNSIRDGFNKFPSFQMEQSFHEYVLKTK